MDGFTASPEKTLTYGGLCAKNDPGITTPRTAATATNDPGTTTEQARKTLIW